MSYAYVGCRTTKERHARGKGLKVYKIEEKSGEWQEIQLIELENPSYLAFDRNKEYLYTVHGDKTEVSAFKIDSATGKLHYLNTAYAGGKNPVYLTIDKTNSYCFVATLQGGKVATLKRGSDGRLSDPVHEVHIPGLEEGNISYPHQCILSQSMDYLLVPAQGRDQGYGQVNVYKVEESGALLKTCALKARPGAEPRHAAVHSNERFVYVLNEKDNSVVYYQLNRETGKLTPKQNVPTLPEYYTGNGEGGTVIIHPFANYLYVSNRIHDSITIFSIDDYTGYLKNIGCVPTLGKTPRHITIDETGKFLYATNEDSDSVVVYAVDEQTGQLTYTGRQIETGSPVCLLTRNT
ncbi:hypothetical protein GCM10011391_21260 [Pullulanibacillus camelliae]|uniref:Lactonase family protein n=1 Tax=Pullulanibacillus camelliae TaxID=1707096 RepID=A0A8J2YHA0_9BACL|nr:lactonase family protein [Pullulanibacillus camelliae]GGE42215.1 hypothetical protein GCM10011391_21260 [Pullulanibacillus camelliae]